MSPSTRLRDGVLAALFLAGAVAPEPATAQYRNMGWNDSTPGNMDLTFDCANPAKEATLVVSFVSPVSDLLAIDVKLDMCTKPADLPAWWRFDLPGGCREGLVEVSTDFSAGPGSHPSAWSSPTSTSLTVVYGYTWSASMNRFVIRIHNGNLQPTPLVPGKEYYAFKLRFLTPAGACSGCDLMACFVLNSLDIAYSGGVMETQLFDGYARWQGDNDCPFVVPALPATWGAVKAAYR